MTSSMSCKIPRPGVWPVQVIFLLSGFRVNRVGMSQRAAKSLRSPWFAHIQCVCSRTALKPDLHDGHDSLDTSARVPLSSLLHWAVLGWRCRILDPRPQSQTSPPPPSITVTGASTHEPEVIPESRFLHPLQPIHYQACSLYPRTIHRNFPLLCSSTCPAPAQFTGRAQLQRT